MAARRGLLYQGVPNYLDRAIAQQSNTTRGVGLYRTGSNTKQKAGKGSGLSNLASTVGVAKNAYEVYDAATNGGKSEGLGNTVKDFFAPASETLGPTVSAAQGLSGEAGKAALDTAITPVAESIAGANTLETSLAAGGTEAGAGAEAMAALSEAWSGVATGAAGAYSWLTTLLGCSDRRLKHDIVYL